MNKKFKVGLVGLLSFALMLSMSGVASAAITLGTDSIVAGTGGALTLTAKAASTWSTNAGALTLTSAAASTWSTAAEDLTLQAASGVGTASLILTADEAVTDAIDINATAGGIDMDAVLASTLTVTSTNDAHDLSLITTGEDFGDIVLTSGDDVAVTAADNITVNTTDGYYTLTTGGVDSGDMTFTVGDDFIMNGAAGSVYIIGAATVGGTITIGGTAQTGALAFGDSTATVAEISIGGGDGNKTAINIGDGTGANGINIGTGATGVKTIAIGSGAAANAVTIGSTNTTASMTINAGTGNLNIGNDTVAKITTINVGAEATGQDLIAIGSVHASSTLTLEAGTAAGGILIGNGATAHGIQIGSNATAANAVKLGGAHASSVTTIEGGTAAGGILIGNGATAHGIQIGNGGAVNTVILGSTNATSTLALNAGVDDATGGITITGAINGASPLSFEGATANSSETILAVTDATADRTITLPNKSGQVQLASAASALTPGAAVTLTVGLSNLYTDTITTDDQDQTITFSAGGTAGDMITIIFITDAAGANDEVITFHTTLANTVGTLTLANVASGRYAVTFMSDGTVWNEIARTAVQS